MRFDQGRGLIIDEREHVVVVPPITELAARYYGRFWAPRAVRVDCGKDVVRFVDVGGELPCVARTSKGALPFVVRILTADGRIDFVDNG